MAKAAHWLGTDAEARKRGEQTGLDTLVVHAVTMDASRRGACSSVAQLTIKHPAWGVRSQD